MSRCVWRSANFSCLSDTGPPITRKHLNGTTLGLFLIGWELREAACSYHGIKILQFVGQDRELINRHFIRSLLIYVCVNQLINIFFPLPVVHKAYLWVYFEFFICVYLLKMKLINQGMQKHHKKQSDLINNIWPHHEKDLESQNYFCSLQKVFATKVDIHL